MNLAPAHLFSRHGGGVLTVLIALSVAVVLTLAPRASADLLYWENWEDPANLSFANADGSGGGPLPMPGMALVKPEGLAYDSAANRLFVADAGEFGEGEGEIYFVDLGTGAAGPFGAVGAPVDEPVGVAFEPASGTLFWVNRSVSGAPSIAWARANGAGGTLNTAGATLDAPYKIAVDPVNGRLYWSSAPVIFEEPATISYANLNNTGGADLEISGVTPEAVGGLAVDPAGGRLFWTDVERDAVSFTGLLGGVGVDLPTTGAPIAEPYGLAYDPSLGRAYWGNFGNGGDRVNAFGVANLAGVVGGITTQAPVSGPQDPLIIKPPVATAPPLLARVAASREWLSCTRGEWGEDYPGSFVYRAPRTYAYQWTRDGAAIPGATKPGLQATEPGSYGCAVTATNQAGSAVVASGAITTARAKLKVLVKTKLRKVKRRKKATFRVQYYNQGDVRSSKPRVCVLVPKKLRGALKAPRCKKLGAVAGKGRRATKLKVFVKPKAKNRAYKLKFVVKGVPSKPSFGRVKVVGKG